MTLNWPSDALRDLLEIELPIVQAPMAGMQGPELTVAVSEAGGLGSLACAVLSPAGIRSAVEQICQATNQPFNLNFFCHASSANDAQADQRWRSQLEPFFAEAALEAPESWADAIAPFDEKRCSLVEELAPKVVSFHFGLPQTELLTRLKQAGVIVLSSANTVAEARHLAEHGADAVIAQGTEAGGHRGMFLTDDIASQAGTVALVPQIADAVDVPVIAAGGIADGRGLVAAFALGAAGAQIGTAYLFTPQARITEHHRAALRASRDDGTVITNVLSGRPARAIVNRVIREVGPISRDAPAFPQAISALGPLRKHAEAAGQDDFSPMWSGQAGALGRELDAGALTRQIAEEAGALLAARLAKTK